MESIDKAESHENAEQSERIDKADEELAESPAAGALIAANLAGVNMGMSTVTTGAPSAGNLGGVSADQAAAVVGGDDDTETGPMDFDALEQFGSKHRRTGDQNVSPEQPELPQGKKLEADELNG